jgi:dTDP-4-dehydrorhamnose reductase
MIRILLTGANGQVGWELRRTLAPLGDVVASTRRSLDLADPDALRRAVRECRPELIVNAAAYTAVDGAESEPERAMAVNGIAPGILAEEGKRVGAALVHFSTDYVFDGRKPTPYLEDDPPAPLNVYGTTKLAGERAIQAVGAPHLVLRTSWVYGARGRNFLLAICRLAGERPELRVVDDQTGAPTWCRMIAEATAQIVARARPGPGRAPFAAGGVYHLTARGATTWFGFARAILASGSALGLASVPALLPIGSEEYGSPARRPANSLLANDKVERDFGVALPPWDDALRMCLEAAAPCHAGRGVR